MNPVCCRVKDASRSSLNASGTPALQMLCPLTQVKYLLIVGTAVMIMQTGTGHIKDLTGLNS